MVVVGMVIAALAGLAVAQSGMMGSGGGQMPMGQPPKAGEDKPGESPSQRPMTPEFAARMLNACINAMEGMAQMGRMMGGHDGRSGGLLTASVGTKAVSRRERTRGMLEDRSASQAGLEKARVCWSGTPGLAGSTPP